MITFELVTLSGVTFSDEVYEVILPTEDGIIAVFPGHMPLVSLAVPGVVSVRRNQSDSDSKLEHFASNGGVIEVNHHMVRMLVDEAAHEASIIEKEVEEALALARTEAQAAKDQVSLDKANQIIQMHQAKLKVAELKRRRRA